MIPVYHTLVGPGHQVAGGNHVVTTRAEALELLSKLNACETQVFGLDTEFVGWKPTDKRPFKNRAEPVVWSLAWSDGTLGNHPWHKKVPLCQRATLAWNDEVLSVFKPWLESPEITKVAHDGFSVEYQVLQNEGVDLNGLLDSLTLCKYADNVPKLGHDLKRHMDETLNYTARSFKELFGDTDLRDIVPGHPLWRTFIDYAGLDAKAALELYFWAKPQVQEMGLWEHFLRVWTPQQYVLTTLDSNGFPYDQEVAASAISEIRSQVEALKAPLDKWAGWQEPYPTKYIRSDLKDASGKKPLLDADGNKVMPRGTYPLHWVPQQVPFNPRSPTALQHFLYGYGVLDVAGQVITGKGFPVPELCGNPNAVKKTRRGQKPTDEMALLTIATNEWLPTPEVHKLQELSEYRKALNLLGKLERFSAAASEEPDGRIRTQFQCRTDTGRLSASNQPWQQVPKLGPMRRAFIARPGYKLVVADYSGLEMRILAHFLAEVYGDRSLIDDILAADVHSATALRVWGRPGGPLEGVPIEDVGDKDHWAHMYRKYAKIVNYAINYGKGPEGLGVQIKDADGRPIGTKAAQALLDDYLDHAYPFIRTWQADLETWAVRDLGISTLHGRFRKLPALGLRKHDKYEKWKYLADLRRAYNTPIQGSAADIVVMAMLQCNPEPTPLLKQFKYVNWTLHEMGALMLAQIHDELIFEVPAEHAEACRDEVKRSMEGAVDLEIPLNVDIHIVDCWADAA